jgi:hypothetical protein
MGEHRAIASHRIWIARAIAVAADLLQIGILPAFIEGVASPVNVALDVLVAILLILLVGWHMAFVPSFIVEMLPFVDLAPTWTLAVFIATRGKSPTARPNDLQVPRE